MSRRTFTDQLAARIVAQEGIAAIWRLHLDAAKAHRRGHPAGAAILIEIADAAEREWARRHLSWAGDGDLINRP